MYEPLPLNLFLLCALMNTTLWTSPFASQHFPLQAPHSQNAAPADRMSAQVPADQVEDAQNTPNTQMVLHSCSTHSSTCACGPSSQCCPFPYSFYDTGCYYSSCTVLCSMWSGAGQPQQLWSVGPLSNTLHSAYYTHTNTTFCILHTYKHYIVHTTHIQTLHTAYYTHTNTT